MQELLDFARFLVRPFGWFAVPLCLAVGASLFSSPTLRRLRNIGMAACYLALPAGIVLLEWRAVVSAWLVIGAATGIIYWLYEVVSRLAAPPPEKGPSPSASTILHGTVAWPVMLPEVIEYALSEIGMLDAGDDVDR